MSSISSSPSIQYSIPSLSSSFPSKSATSILWSLAYSSVFRFFEWNIDRKAVFVPKFGASYYFPKKFIEQIFD